MNWRLKVTYSDEQHLQLCIWQTLLSKVTYIEGFLFIRFRFFSIDCLFQLNVSYIDMDIKKTIVQKVYFLLH